MTKVKILALLVGMVLLFTLPATVSAQRLPPHVFVGTAMMDGATVADGTTVSAWVLGMEAASTTVTGGSYVIVVDQGDQSYATETVTFQIGGNDAAETATWMQGGGDELNLTASGAMAMEPTTSPEPTVAPVAMAPGATGVPGARGSAGPSGPEGVAGPSGAQGATGPTGAAGPAGSSGSAGPAGDAGATGDTGPAGSGGGSGPAGASGAPGSEGDDASNVLGIIALIIAIIAIVGAGGAFLLGRRS